MSLCMPLHVDRADALAQALRAEGVPVNAIAVNQVTPCAVAVALDCRHRQVALLKSHAPACQLQVLEASASQQFLASKRADQQRALAKLREDPALRCCLCCLLCRRCCASKRSQAFQLAACGESVMMCAAVDVLAMLKHDSVLQGIGSHRSAVGGLGSEGRAGAAVLRGYCLEVEHRAVTSSEGGGHHGRNGSPQAC